MASGPGVRQQGSVVWSRTLHDSSSVLGTGKFGIKSRPVPDIRRRLDGGRDVNHFNFLGVCGIPLGSEPLADGRFKAGPWVVLSASEMRIRGLWRWLALPIIALLGV